MLSKLFYSVKNIPAHLRAFILGSSNGDGKLVFRGDLAATVFRKTGKIINLGLLSRRVVTTAGVNYMRDDFNNATGGADITNFNWHDSGTGAVAENITDVGLGTPTGIARPSGVQSAPATKQYRTVATITYNAGFAITEHGIFSAVTAGTLWDRSVFAAINVINGDSIAFTYTLSITDGG